MERGENGGIYVAGFFRDTVDMDPGSGTSYMYADGGKDIFLAKYNEVGNFLWAKHIGGTDHEEAYDLQLDGKGNLYMTGYFKGNCDFDPSSTQAELISNGGGDIFLAKYDTSGSYQWAFLIGEGNNDWQVGKNLGLDQDANPIISGEFEGTIDFDPDPVGTHNLVNPTAWNYDLFVAKYHRNTRDVLFAKAINGKDPSYSDHVEGMTVDDNGNIIITGEANDTVDFDPGPSTAYVSSDRGTGSSNNIFLAKYDSTMNYQWAFMLGDNGYDDLGMDIGTDGFGNIYLTGYFRSIADFDPGPDSTKHASNGGGDVFLAKYGPNASHQWSFNIGSNYTDKGTSLALDGEGSIFIAGQVGNWGSPVDFDPDPIYTDNYYTQGDGDIFIAKYDTSGDHLVAEGMGGSQWDYISECMVDTTGSAWITGSTESTNLDMDPGADTSLIDNPSSYWEPFLAQYCAPPAVELDTSMFSNEVCQYDPSFSLVGGSPSGGDFSGPGVSGNTFYPSNAGPGTHVVTYTYINENGCSNSDTTEITVHPKPAQPQIQRVSADTLRSSVNASSYQWFYNGAAYGPDARKVEVTQAGDYQLVTGKNGCYSDTSASYCLIPLEVTNITNSTCGNANGEATVNIVGGNAGDYSFEWSTGSDSITAVNLAAGTYSVRVKDTVRGCENMISVTISDQGGPAVSTSIDHVSCHGLSDGEISLGVSGTAPPYRVQWSNGDTVPNISGLAAGPYEVVVTDNNGCQTVKSIQVGEPDPLQLTTSSTPAGCGNSNGSATVEFQGGTSPYQINWVNVGSSSDPATMTNLASGAYEVVVTDDNGCSSSKMVMVSETDAPNITLDSIVPAACDGTGGSAYISASGGVAPYTYSWSNGDGTEDLMNAPAGEYYVTVTGDNGCQAMLDTNVGIMPPPAQEICMVTVDSAIQKNVVAWEKSNTSAIDHYNIYRESSQSNVYFHIGSVDVDSLSIYTDSVADPAVRSWRYKISTVDTCGNESSLSEHHETIHLNINQGLNNTVNLDWNDYEGFQYQSFYISRYDDVNGWHYLDTVNTNVNTYTDTMPPQTSFLTYAVEAVPNFICTATRAKDFNSTRSNHRNMAGPDSDNNIISSEKDDESLRIFPNPSDGKLNLEFLQKDRGTVSLRVMDGKGKLVEDKAFGSVLNVKTSLDLSDERRGIYLFQVITEDGKMINRRVVIQ